MISGAVVITQQHVSASWPASVLGLSGPWVSGSFLISQPGGFPRAGLTCIIFLLWLFQEVMGVGKAVELVMSHFGASGWFCRVSPRSMRMERGTRLHYQ